MLTKKIMDDNSQKLLNVFKSLSTSSKMDFLQLFMRTHTKDQYEIVIDMLGEEYSKIIPRA